MNTENIYGEKQYTFVPSAKLKMLLWVGTAVGISVFFITLLFNPQRAWYTYLMVYYYFLCLGLSGLFFVALNYASKGKWFIPVRRVAEGMASYLFISLILFLGLLPGVREIYVWAKPGLVHMSSSKAVYLSIPFFTIRQIIFLFIWIYFAWLLIRSSLKQDISGKTESGDPNVRISILFLVLFAVTFTLTSVDLLMSLEPKWYSTIFGVYCFSGLFSSGFAALTLAVILLRHSSNLAQSVQDIHLKDLGTWMMGSTWFMMYIGFSQYLLIWYANLPGETIYLMKRQQNGWEYVFILLPLLKWIIPFFGLIPRKARGNERILVLMSIIILIGQWLDIYWMIVPVFSKFLVTPGLTEIGMTIGFLGIFGLSLFRFYSKNSVIAYNDPELYATVLGKHLH